MSLDIRKVQEINKSTVAVTLPKEYGLKKGDLIRFEKIDEITFKITKMC